MSHLSYEDRKVISNLLSHEQNCREIALAIGCDPTTIAKELKRNRKMFKLGDANKVCPKLNRFPYTCIGCELRYAFQKCQLSKYTYDAQYAHELYLYRLHNSRKGIDLTKEEAEHLIATIKKGLEEKKSVYASIKANDLNTSVASVYRYIDKGQIPIRKIDLPYATTYKKRKRKTKEYDYPDNKIDRSNRTFLDFLAYIKANLNEMFAQMDFLGKIKSDRCELLVIIINEIHFFLLFLIEEPDSKKVVQVFNDLEELLGPELFAKMFPAILTDRDPCFKDFYGIEFSHLSGVQRTRIFYCDAYKSTQKAVVENANKQLRKFFPKGSSIDGYTKEQINLIAKTINETPVASLDGNTPKDAFIRIFGEEAYHKLFK